MSLIEEYLVRNGFRPQVYVSVEAYASNNRRIFHEVYKLLSLAVAQ